MSESLQGSFRVSFHLPAAPADLSPRGRQVAEVFGIDAARGPRVLFDELEVPGAGICLITGFSGSGKSSLLRCIAAARPQARWVTVEAPDRGSVIDRFDADLSTAIHWLGKFGLAEARVLLAPPARLSDGQKHRLALAEALWHRPEVVLVDEFLASLDRVTAQVVAHNFQKVCRERGVTAYVATAHHDLTDALRPDHVLWLDLDSRVTARPPSGAEGLPLERELVDDVGSVADYHALAAYHYRDLDDQWIDWDNLVREVRVVRHHGRPVAVKVFSRPFSRQLEKIPLFRELNQAAILQERVIVHPAFRGLGLNRRMVPTDPGAARIVFAQSALGRFFPYNLRAGFTRVPHPSAEPTEAQRRLRARLTDATVNPQSSAALAAWLDTLDPDPRAAVVRDAVDAFTDATLLQVRFVAALVGRPLGAAESGALERSFRKLAERTPADGLGRLIEVGMPFPMDAFVRTLPG